jgi:hypothetical protein
MIDVLHFLFEEDSVVSSAEKAEAKESVRVRIYEDMYGVEYEFKAARAAASGLDNIDPPFGDEDEAPIPVDPFAKSGYVKPYTPATDFDPDALKPFGSVLDAPLGH